MPEKLGVEDVKKIAGLTIDVVNQCVISFKDGFQPQDLTQFFDEGLAIAGNFKSFKEFIPQIKDMDRTEFAEVVLYVKEKLKIVDAGAVAFLTNKIFAAVIANAELTYAIIAVKKGEDPEL